MTFGNKCYLKMYSNINIAMSENLKFTWSTEVSVEQVVVGQPPT